MEKNLAELVIEVINEVVEGLDKGEAVALAARKVLKEAGSRAETTLLVSPKILNDVKRRLQEFLGSGARPAIAVEPDASLSEDEARLVTEFAAVDLSLKRQLELLGQSLRSAHVGAGV